MVCVCVYAFMPALVLRFFYSKHLLRYFIIFLSRPCLVDMDCMVSIGCFLIYAKLKGFYTGIFVKNVYHNWQCSFGLIENVKTKKNWSRVSDLYLSIITFFFFNFPPKKYITTIYLSVSSWLYLNFFSNLFFFSLNQEYHNLRYKKLIIKIMNLQVQNHLVPLLSNLLHRFPCASIQICCASYSSIQFGLSFHQHNLKWL